MKNAWVIWLIGSFICRVVAIVIALLLEYVHIRHIIQKQKRLMNIHQAFLVVLSLDIDLVTLPLSE